MYLFLCLNLKQTRIQKKKDSVGGLGVFAGILASGCSSCGVGVLAVLGVVGGTAILPLGGFEIWGLSTVILLVSLFYLSKGINTCHACQIQLKT